MKLYQIHENEYADLEDTDEFGTPAELVAMLKLQNWINNNWLVQLWNKKHKFRSQEFEGSRPTISSHLSHILRSIYGGDVYDHAQWQVGGGEPTHEDLELAYGLIKSDPDLTEWWESVAEMPERLEPSYGRYPEEPPDFGDLLESDEYEGLEDLDEFSTEFQPPICTICGEPTDSIMCSNEFCNNGAHLECLLQNPDDEHKYNNADKEALSSGWFFSRLIKDRWGNKTRTRDEARHRDILLCPNCSQHHNLIESDEYEGLEDVDEFKPKPEAHQEESWQTFQPEPENPSQYAVVYYQNGILNIEVLRAVSEALGTPLETHDLSDEGGDPIEPASTWNVPFDLGYNWVRLHSALPTGITAEGNDANGNRWITVVEDPITDEDGYTAADRRALGLEESEYEDLEDVDEFVGDDNRHYDDIDLNATADIWECDFCDADETTAPIGFCAKCGAQHCDSCDPCPRCLGIAESEYEDLEDVDEFAPPYFGPTNIGGFKLGPHEFDLWEYTDEEQNSSIELYIDRWTDLGQIPEQLKLKIKQLLHKFLRSHARDLLHRIDPQATLNEWIYQAAMLAFDYIHNR